MVIADSSAWIAYLRDQSGGVADQLEVALRARDLVTTDPVMMEVLAGARTPEDEERLMTLLAVAKRMPCERADYVEAARIHRMCRANGEAVRNMLDCLIASVAIRIDASLLHADRDFEVIARHSGLTLV